jgi:hypothetical protein
MKRILYFLLLVLMIASTLGTAEAKTKKQPKKPATIDMDNGGARDGDGDRDKDRPKRARNIKKEKKAADGDLTAPKPGPIPVARPIELQLKRGASKRFDLRALPARRPSPRERPELQPPNHTVVEIEGNHLEVPPPSIPGVPPTANPPAPPPNIVFEGLDREFWGAGSPPDTTGDVGPQYYIQAVNTSVGIYDKAGNQQAAFTFDTLMSQGAFGNLCDTENFGDPVVLYDSFEDRWVLTDFAFLTDGGGNPISPAYQCFAVSMNGNPLTGGWNFYSIQISDFLNDYEKLAIWPDGIYMSANMFGFGPGGTFQTARAWAFNKMQMYAGSPTVQVVAFNIPGGDFAVMPSNARLQTGTPPPGRPNLFMSTWLFANAVSVYKFHVDWNSISLSTFTGPDTPVSASSWPGNAVGNAPQPGTAQLLDVLQVRAMVQNQYTNFGGVESLWVPHTVRRANTSGFAAPRWYQIDVTGGNVNPTIPQAATWDPDGANVNHRFMPSLALDRAGNLAMGYSISNATTMFPSMAYAGRLAGDPVNTFSQTETMMFTGTASQTSSVRWGDYSSMMLDPNGCTFWYTNEYANPAAQTFDKRWKTKIGSFQYPSCTPVGAGGTVTGTVTVTPGGTPISGATITFGARTTTTNGSGVYSFLSIPAGTYPSISATKPGYSTASASNIVVTDGGTTVQDFALTVAPTSACLTDTTQADFQTGVLTNVDVTTSPGDVTLSNAPVSDQANTAGTTTGTGFGTPAWTGQTFIAGVTGQLVKADIQLFCNGCGATPPNLTLSVRATSAGLPTGADLASVTVPGSAFASGAITSFTATFGAPATLTSGTQYALILRPVSAPAGSGYFWIRSSPSTYASGSRVLSADSGGTWSTDTTRDYNFRTYMQVGYAPNGNLVSGTKDSNPLGGLTPIWSTLSWNGSTPANTSLQYQVAGSNNPNGPFTFIGPDGTAGTFFTTSPGTLDVLYNLRYAKYKAYLATTNSAATPVVNDVTMCFNDVDCTAPISITPTPSTVCANSTGNTASGPAGATSYSWSITNGTITSATNTQSITYTAGPSGNVGLMLSIVEAAGCHKSTNTNVPIEVPSTPTATNGGPYCEGNTIQLNTPTQAGATYAWTGPNGFTSSLQNPTRSNATLADAGTYSVVVTSVNGCVSPAGGTNVVVNATPATPTATNGGPYCEGSTIQLNTPTVASATYAWTGPNGFTSSLQNPTRTSATTADGGTYSVTVTVDGCPSAAGTTNVVVNAIPATPTATNGGPYCDSGSGVTVQLNTPTVAGATYAWTGPTGFTSSLQNPTRSGATPADAGSYSVTVTVNGCTSAAGSTTVVINTTPATPTATNGGPYCAGSTIQLNTPTVAGATYAWTGPNGFTSSLQNPTRTNAAVADGGTYSVTVTVNGCTSAAGTTNVVVNAIPATPTATNGGPYCDSGSGVTVQLNTPTVAGATYAWTGPNGFTSSLQNPTRPGATTADAGTYSVTVTVNSCTSAAGTTNVVINATPATPTATNGGPYCVGQTIQLNTPTVAGATYAWTGPGGFTSSLQNPTRTNAQLAHAGAYNVTVTVNGCTSAAGSTTVAVNANPDATITAPSSVVAGSTGNLASVANAGGGATYNWSITNGTITAGTGTANITFTAGATGTLTLQCTVTTSAGCSDTKSKNVNVTTAIPPPTVTSVVPPAGKTAGGKNVTINGTNFQSGATITFGGNAATNVVFVSSTKLTAKTPAHAAGFVNVTVTNPDAQSGTLPNGYKYVTQQFDANNDGLIDPSDIFWLVNYLFLSGAPPSGPSGMDSGDANGDAVVDSADIFYLVNYLFMGGPAPSAESPRVTTSSSSKLSGAVSLGTPVLRNGKYTVPVLVSMGADSVAPQAMSLRVKFSEAVKNADIHRAGVTAGAKTAFEISRPLDDSLAYLVVFDDRVSGSGLQPGQQSVIAEIVIEARENAGLSIEIDPALTMLSDQGGTRSATVAAGTLRVSGTKIESRKQQLEQPKKNVE